jgi:4-amino-4-deoxy-L-arabinose transferase-like glycosyltransferase
MNMRLTDKLISILRGDSYVNLPAVFIVLISAGAKLLRLHRGWESARGFESEWIGRAIAGGHGFSFPGDSRWLFAPLDANHFFPTAWSEPFPPFFIGANLYLFGEYGKLSILLFNVLFHMATAVCIFRFVKRSSGTITAYIALIVFINLPSWVVTGYLGNSVFTGLLIIIFCLIAAWFFDTMNWGRAVISGLFLGGLAVVHAGTLLFTPAFVAIVLVWNRFNHRSLQSALLIALSAATIVLPWTIRNYLTFNEFVPVRNGIGQILHVSNLSLGKTTLPPATVAEDVPVPWRSRNLWDAYRKLSNTDMRRALERYSEKLIAAEAGADYLAANEAIRDKYLSAAAKQHILAHPFDTLRLSLIKGLHFFFINWPQYRFMIPIGSIITILAGIGAILSWKKKELFVVTTLIICYSAPYLLTAPYFYRYRYPIDPLVIILFSHVISVAIGYLHPRFINK